MSDKAIEMLEVGAWDVEVATADLVDGFVVDQESAVGVLDGAVSRKNCIVWFDNCSGDTRSRIDGEFEL